jgi:hypothetical protein
MPTKKPQVREYQTDGTFIDRDMTASELAQYEIEQANYNAQAAELAAKAEAKAELLAKLGITAEEAVLLLS